MLLIPARLSDMSASWLPPTITALIGHPFNKLMPERVTQTFVCEIVETPSGNLIQSINSRFLWKPDIDYFYLPKLINSGRSNPWYASKMYLMGTKGKPLEEYGPPIALCGAPTNYETFP